MVRFGNVPRRVSDLRRPLQDLVQHSQAIRDRVQQLISKDGHKWEEAADTRNLIRIGLAVSGGTDSLALATLFATGWEVEHRKHFRAFVVDHGLREGSLTEARAVADLVWERGIPASVLKIQWPSNVDIHKVKNFETIARTHRYRTLGAACRLYGINYLCLGHHLDDQAETILMRLSQGHHANGLKGMKAISGIPECEGMYGVHESGGHDNFQQREAAAHLKSFPWEVYRADDESADHQDRWKLLGHLQDGFSAVRGSYVFSHGPVTIPQDDDVVQSMIMARLAATKKAPLKVVPQAPVLTAIKPATLPESPSARGNATPLKFRAGKPAESSVNHPKKGIASIVRDSQIECYMSNEKLHLHALRPSEDMLRCLFTFVASSSSILFCPPFRFRPLSFLRSLTQRLDLQYEEVQVLGMTKVKLPVIYKKPSSAKFIDAVTVDRSVKESERQDSKFRRTIFALVRTLMQKKINEQIMQQSDLPSAIEGFLRKRKGMTFTIKHNAKELGLLRELSINYHFFYTLELVQPGELYRVTLIRRGTVKRCLPQDIQDLQQRLSLVYKAEAGSLPKNLSSRSESPRAIDGRQDTVKPDRNAVSSEKASFDSFLSESTCGDAQESPVDPIVDQQGAIQAATTSPATISVDISGALTEGRVDAVSIDPYKTEVASIGTSTAASEALNATDHRQTDERDDGDGQHVVQQTTKIQGDSVGEKDADVLALDRQAEQESVVSRSMSAVIGLEKSVTQTSHSHNDQRPKAARFAVLDQFERGGIKILRPLLGYRKASLERVCEVANIVPFEDKTNQDATLTPRNAIRQLLGSADTQFGGMLPAALQTVSLGKMQARISDRAKSVEDMAEKVLTTGASIYLFPPVGGLGIRFKSNSFLGKASQEPARLKLQQDVALKIIEKLVLSTSSKEVEGRMRTKLAALVFSWLFPNIESVTKPFAILSFGDMFALRFPDPRPLLEYNIMKDLMELPQEVYDEHAWLFCPRAPRRDPRLDNFDGFKVLFQIPALSPKGAAPSASWRLAMDRYWVEISNLSENNMEMRVSKFATAVQHAVNLGQAPKLEDKMMLRPFVVPSIWDTATGELLAFPTLNITLPAGSGRVTYRVRFRKLQSWIEKAVRKDILKSHKKKKPKPPDKHAMYHKIITMEAMLQMLKRPKRKKSSSTEDLREKKTTSVQELDVLQKEDIEPKESLALREELKQDSNIAQTEDSKPSNGSVRSRIAEQQQNIISKTEAEPKQPGPPSMRRRQEEKPLLIRRYVMPRRTAPRKLVRYKHLKLRSQEAGPGDAAVENRGV